MNSLQLEREAQSLPYVALVSAAICSLDATVATVVMCVHLIRFLH
jgi:hypothetical protein